MQPPPPPPTAPQSERERLLLSLFDYGSSPGISADEPEDEGKKGRRKGGKGAGKGRRKGGRGSE
jgi:hypothetical protein